MTPNYDSLTPLVSAVHGQTPFPWACFHCVWFVRSLIILQLLSKFQASVSNLWVMWWCSWLRQCLTRQKVTGSISGGVTGISHWHNPSRCTVALESTQPLNRNEYQIYFLGGKGSQCIGLTTYHLHMSWNLGALTPWNPLGLNMSVQGSTSSPLLFGGHVSFLHTTHSQSTMVQCST
jgi:hypothetical protein